uniref:Uncharacterized protein n=1 Tax=Romanomermis culicivorax TaxID=13658 RepID=A0A915I2A3_ROMCU
MLSIVTGVSLPALINSTDGLPGIIEKTTTTMKTGEKLFVKFNLVAVDSKSKDRSTKYAFTSDLIKLSNRLGK